MTVAVLVKVGHRAVCFICCMATCFSRKWHVYKGVVKGKMWLTTVVSGCHTCCKCLCATLLCALMGVVFDVRLFCVYEIGAYGSTLLVWRMYEFLVFVVT